MCVCVGFFKTVILFEEKPEKCSKLSVDPVFVCRHLTGKNRANINIWRLQAAFTRLPPSGNAVFCWFLSLHGVDVEPQKSGGAG